MRKFALALIASLSLFSATQAIAGPVDHAPRSADELAWGCSYDK